MKKIAFLSLAMVLIISACGKYPEGPGLSLASKKSRLAGDWNIKSYTTTLNGVETDLMNNTVSNSYPCLFDLGATTVTLNTVTTVTSSTTFQKDGQMSSTTSVSVATDDWTNILTTCGTTTTTTVTSSSSTGTWEFGDKKETLIVTQTIQPGNTTDTYEWEILELRKKQIQLTRTDTANKVHLMVLEPK